MEHSEIRKGTPADAGPVRLILASASPRRREILTEAGVAFEVVPSHIPEEERPGEKAEEYACRLAREKALAVAAELSGDGPSLVLGADTVVVLGERVMGKPDDEDHAVALLKSLVGQRHRVITGVAVVTSPGGRVFSRAVVSEVSMRHADESEIRDYVATGEPMDKAGAYAVQGEGGRRFVEALVGSRSNVIGLPLEQTLELLDAGAESLKGSRP